MARQMLLLLLLALWDSTPTISTRIDGVCTPPASSSGMARPKVSNVFRVNVECNMQEQNRTIFVREYFDYDNNQGRITQVEEFRTGDIFFDYNNDQIVIVNSDTLECLVGDLSSSDNRFMFGYRTSVHGMPHVFGASGALHFGDAPETYVGKAVVRGIVVNQWDSCQYSDALNATMKVTWYFSSKTEWDMQLGARSVPVRVIAVGKQYKPYGQIVPFNHTYDFFKFEEYVYPEDFEIPVGVVCPGRIVSKPFPQLPQRFSFIGEVQDNDRATVTYIEESYDSVAKINVFSYKNSSDVYQLSKVDRMLQVNDYNSGLSYVVDRTSGICQVGQLGTEGVAFLHYLADGEVTMMTPGEFLADDSAREYSYVGERVTRGIPCELWVANTDKVQGYTDQNLTVEWYFAVQQDVETWNTEVTGWRIPVRFRIWQKEVTDPIYDINVFYYDTTRPKVISVDFLSCFTASQRQRATMAFDSKYKEAVSNNIEMFKYALTSAVSSLAGISQLRVADIQVYYDPSNTVLVSFDLLGKPSVHGDVTQVTPENDLATAYRLYNASLASGNLRLTVGVGANAKTITPIHNTITPIQNNTGHAAGMARPKVSNVFRVNVECAMQEQNRTIFVREYFDYDNNRGRITQVEKNRIGDVFFDYNNDQIVIVDPDTLECLVGDLSSSDDRFMFGYRTSVHGMPHVFGASGALHFGDAPETYVGKAVVRGIVVNQWDSYQSSDALNATMQVTWYFSSKTEWDMQLGARTVPVRAIAVGKQYKPNGQIVPFNHTYDFFRYEENVYPEDFEIPVGVVCPGRIASKPFPQLPQRFSFIGEVQENDMATVTYIEESYDSAAKINVFSYKDSGDVQLLSQVDRMLQVNDYNSGLSYVVDREAGTCQVGQLGTKGYAFLHYLADGKVTMMTAGEFLADDSAREYSYVGERVTRGVPCELWVANTDKIQGYTDQNLTVEWYFAVQQDVEDWNTEETGWRIPVRFRMWQKKDTDPIYDFNVFYYDTSRPKVISVDLSSCFTASQRQRATMAFDSKYKEAVSNNIEMFKYALTSAVSAHAGISQLRVADIQVYYDPSNTVLVSFDLLGKPSVHGDVTHVTPENDLATAYRLYNASVASGNLRLTVGVGANAKTITPIHNGSTGYAAGALAGLGVAMLVVGSAGGAGAGWFFSR